MEGPPAGGPSLHQRKRRTPGLLGQDGRRADARRARLEGQFSQVAPGGVGTFRGRPAIGRAEAVTAGWVERSVRIFVGLSPSSRRARGNRQHGRDAELFEAPVSISTSSAWMRAVTVRSIPRDQRILLPGLRFPSVPSKPPIRRPTHRMVASRPPVGQTWRMPRTASAETTEGVYP